MHPIESMDAIAFQVSEKRNRAYNDLQPENNYQDLSSTLANFEWREAGDEAGVAAR